VDDRPLARQVEPADAALLAGLIASPSRFDPVENPHAAKQRRDVVLQKMREQQLISEGQYRVKIIGKLTLHGVTNNCTIDAQMWVMPESLRAQGEFPLRQTDYRIKLVSAAGGTIKVKDELKFAFDIVTNKV